jgi:hypothetical protein
MKKQLTYIGIALAILIVLYCLTKKEAFTSPGTMVQLASSHVPTQEDVDYYKYVYPKMVRHDLADMTGEDPGPIPVPMPQLWF